MIKYSNKGNLREDGLGVAYSSARGMQSIKVGQAKQEAGKAWHGARNRLGAKGEKEESFSVNTSPCKAQLLKLLKLSPKAPPASTSCSKGEPAAGISHSTHNRTPHASFSSLFLCLIIYYPKLLVVSLLLKSNAFD